jgi:hypothetical protein
MSLNPIGWQGFDPTNGVLTQAEQFRVATINDRIPSACFCFMGRSALV